MLLGEILINRIAEGISSQLGCPLLIPTLVIVRNHGEVVVRMGANPGMDSGLAASLEKVSNFNINIIIIRSHLEMGNHGKGSGHEVMMVRGLVGTVWDRSTVIACMGIGPSLHLSYRTMVFIHRLFKGRLTIVIRPVCTTR
jgi:hypothetical protein